MITNYEWYILGALSVVVFALYVYVMWFDNGDAK
jgi:hypothetical protein